jgi:hypothetical protein
MYGRTRPPRTSYSTMSTSTELKYPSRRSVFRINPDGTLDRDFNAVTIELSNYALF